MDQMKTMEQQKMPVEEKKIETVTKQKSSGRVMAGKKLAEFNKIHRWNKQAKESIQRPPEKQQEPQQPLIENTATNLKGTNNTDKEYILTKQLVVSDNPSSSKLSYKLVLFGVGVLSVGGYFVYKRLKQPMKTKKHKNTKIEQTPVLDNKTPKSSSLSTDLFKME